MEVLGQPGTMDYFKLAEGGSWHLTLTSGYFLIIRDKEYCLSSFNTRRRLSNGQVCRKGFESCVTINVCFNHSPCICVLLRSFYTVSGHQCNFGLQ